MIREIVKYPDKKLFQMSIEVKEINEKIKTLIKDLTETMYADTGLGISAIQVGQPERIFIVDGKVINQEEPLIFINPKITKYGDEKITEQEGCLSFDNIFINIKRSKEIKIEYQKESGELAVLEAKDLLARVIQHEYDHLNGKLLIDHASFILKKSIARKMVQGSGS